MRLALAETGRRLWELQAPSLGAFFCVFLRFLRLCRSSRAVPRHAGAFILAQLAPGGGALSPSGAPSGGALADALAAALPAFADVASYGQASLPFHAKALHLVCDLFRRYSEEDPSRFAFCDIGSLPAPADASLVAALRRRGAIRTSDELAARLNSGALLPSGGAEEVALRAAAVAAAAAAAAAAPGGVTPLQLWHWLSANEEAHAEGEGGAGLHLTRDTTAY